MKEKSKMKPGTAGQEKKDALRVIKEHFPGENSCLREIINKRIPGAVDSIEMKVYAPCVDSPKTEYDQPGYTTFQIKLIKDAKKVGEQVSAVKNQSLLKQLIEELVYIYGCGGKAANIVVDCEPAVFPAYSIPDLNKN